MTPHDWATVPDASVPSQQYCRRCKVLKLTAEHTRGFSTRPNEHDGCPAEHVPVAPRTPATEPTEVLSSRRSPDVPSARDESGLGSSTSCSVLDEKRQPPTTQEIPQGGEFTAEQVIAEADALAEEVAQGFIAYVQPEAMLRAYARALSSAPGERTPEAKKPDWFDECEENR
jgi:hypothetical protein